MDTVGLHSQQDWKFCRFAKTFRPEEVADINSKIGMTSGNTVYYNLQAVMNSRRTFPLATGIPDKHEARWPAAEMLRLLKPGEFPASLDIKR